MSRSLHVTGYGCKQTPLGDFTDVVTLGPANTGSTTTGWGTGSRRLVATPGDGTGADGLPDLYSVVHNDDTKVDELWVNNGASNADSDGPHLGAHRVLDEGTRISWGSFTNLA